MPYGIDKSIGGDSPENDKWMEGCVSKVSGTNKRTGNPYTKSEKIAICKAQLKRVREKNSSESDSAKWTAAYINTLPDSSFLYISPGGKKDNEGKTVPRSLRHLPYKDASGKIDLPHLRNASQRLTQTQIPANVKARLRGKIDRLLKQAHSELEIEIDQDIIDSVENSVHNYAMRLIKSGRVKTISEALAYSSRSLEKVNYNADYLWRLFTN